MLFRSTLAGLADRFTRGRDDRPLALVLAAIAAIAIGHAMSLHHRSDFPGFLPWIGGALVLLVLALVQPRAIDRVAPRISREALLLAVLAVGITWGAWELLTVPDELPIPGPAGRWLEGSDARTLVVVAWILAITGLRREAPLGRWQMPALIAVVGILGIWLIKVMTDPPIDVWVFQRDAAQHLLSGANPYAMDFPNIYDHTRYYGEGVVVDGRVTYGYPYLPVTLAFYVPTEAIAADPRFGNLAALLLAAGLIAWAHRGPVARGALGMLLLTPTVLFILRYSWTEPVVLLALAATVAAAVRAQRPGPQGPALP